MPIEQKVLIATVILIALISTGAVIGLALWNGNTQPSNEQSPKLVSTIRAVTLSPSNNTIGNNSQFILMQMNSSDISSYNPLANDIQGSFVGMNNTIVNVSNSSQLISPFNDSTVVPSNLLPLGPDIYGP